MLKALLVLNVSGFVEVVHVELSYETWKVIMLEVFWEDLIRKQVYLLHYESIALLVPSYDVVRERVLDNLISFYEERRDARSVCFILMQCLIHKAF